MLSRIALRSVLETNSCLSVAIRPCASVAKSSDASKEVTFERRKRPIHPGKVRLGFIPEEWFQFFHSKTGVTGPYVFGVSFLTYLYSKEILILEHEAFTGISLALMAVYGIKKFGPQMAEYLDKELDADENMYRDHREKSMANIKGTIEGEKVSQWQAQGQTLLYDAKRENVGLQLEAAYRQRLVDIHSQVKKKLDYQLETANVKTKFEQRHMVNWIVDSVRKSITPAQEAAALKQCLGDLKALSAKA